MTQADFKESDVWLMSLFLGKDLDSCFRLCDSVGCNVVATWIL